MDQSNKSFLRAFTALLSGNAAGQFVWIASVPVLTRLYEPAALGLWLVAMTAILVVGVFATLRLELGIVLAGDVRSAAMTTAAALVALAFTLVFSGAVIAFAQPWLARQAWWVPDGWVLLGLPAIFLAAGMAAILTHWAIRTRRYRTLAVNAIGRALLVNGVAVGLGITGVSNAGLLVAACLLAHLLATVGLAVALRDVVPWRSVMRTRWADIGNEFRLRRPLIIYSTPYGVLNFLASRGLDVIGAATLGPAVAALVGVAMRMSYLPISLITRPLNDIYFGWMANSADRAAVARIVRDIELILVMAATPVAVAVAFHASVLVPFLFGVAWTSVGTYVSWLVFPALLVLITAWLDRTYDLAGRQRLSFFMDSIFRLGLLGTIFAAVRHYATGEAIVVPFAIGVVIYDTLWLAVTFRVARFPLRAWADIIVCLIVVAGSAALVHYAVMDRNWVWQVAALLLSPGGWLAVAAWRIRRFSVSTPVPIASRTAEPGDVR